MGFAFHAWVVPEDSIKHVFFSELESILMCDLARNDTSGRLRVPEVIHS